VLKAAVSRARFTIVQTTDKLVCRRLPGGIGHTQGSRYPPPCREAFANAQSRAFERCSWTTAVFTPKSKCAPAVRASSKIAARLGGDRIATHLTTALHRHRSGARHSRHLVADLPTCSRNGLAARPLLLQCRTRGVITAIRGLEDIPKCPARVMVAGADRGKPLQPGFEISAVQSSLDRYGYSIFSGSGQPRPQTAPIARVQLTFEFAS